MPATREPESERELVSTRVVDCPRERVYAAFSDGAALAAWWGPAGFSNTFQEFAFTPGGVWRFVMHSPDGQDFENESVFLEVVAPERIVLRHLRPVHEYEMTISLMEESGRTRLTLRMVFDSAAEYQRVREFVVPANEQNFDRLEMYLGKRR